MSTPSSRKPADVAERLLEGDRLAIARLITWAENGDPRYREALPRFYPRVGRGWRVGVTGPPGAGKSTLVNEMTKLFRAGSKSVGVLAVDPSSPFTGGALLGDRIRMEERTTDTGVFIRSMASRGSHGGLARTTVDACDVMDAAGFEEVLVETVGVGQAEYDVVSAADTVVVVVCPGAGDGVQAMKSGLLEVADVLVVNKADVLGADRLALDLEEAVHIRRTGSRVRAQETTWTTPVVTCSAGRGQDVENVLEAIDRHRAHVSGEGLEEKRRAKRVGQVRRTVGEALDEELWDNRGCGERVAALLAAGATPYEVAAEVLQEIVERLPAPNGIQPGAGR